MDAYLKDQLDFTGVKVALLVEKSILVVLRDNKPDIPWLFPIAPLTDLPVFLIRIRYPRHEQDFVSLLPDSFLLPLERCTGASF